MPTDQPFPADLAATLTRLRLERGAQHLHALGVRALFELLTELERHTPPGMVLAAVCRYEALTLPMVRAAGGTRMPRRALRRVPT